MTTPTHSPASQAPPASPLPAVADEIGPRPKTVSHSRSRKRDISTRQLAEWMQAHGVKPGIGLFGYVELPHGLHVSVHNAGPRNRDKQAYLAGELLVDAWQHAHSVRRAVLTAAGAGA